MNEDIIATKLDILIKLTAANITKDDKTQTESILKLNEMGIGYKDIAKILGTSDNYVAMIISKNKSKKTKSKKQEEDNESGITERVEESEQEN